MTRPQLCVPITAQQQQPLPAREPGHQIGEHIQRAQVGPLQVVDHQRHRPGLQQLPDRRAHPVQHNAAVGGGTAQLQPRAQRLRDRQVRRCLGGEAHTPAPEQLEILRAQLCCHLGQQPGLAHSRLAVHQHRRWRPGTRIHSRPPQQLQFIDPPHQRGRGPHASQCGSGHGRCPRSSPGKILPTRNVSQSARADEPPRRGAQRIACLASICSNNTGTSAVVDYRWQDFPGPSDSGGWRAKSKEHPPIAGESGGEHVRGCSHSRDDRRSTCST
jgi:hypothetical protein